MHLMIYYNTSSHVDALCCSFSLSRLQKTAWLKKNQLSRILPTDLLLFTTFTHAHIVNEQLQISVLNPMGTYCDVLNMFETVRERLNSVGQFVCEYFLCKL